MCVQGGGNRRINAARYADHDFCQSGLQQKVLYAVPQAGKDAVDSRVVRNGDRRSAGVGLKIFESYLRQLLFKWRAMQKGFAVASVCGAASVESIQGFTVVLDTDIVYIH